MSTTQYQNWCTTANDTSSKMEWQDNAFIHESTARPKKMSKAPEKIDKKIEDEVLRVIAGLKGKRYFVKNQFVWFMDREKRAYDDKTIGILTKYYSLAPFVYDPINGDHKHSIPNVQNWYEGFITDCMEHHEDYMVRANMIKFGLSCISQDSSARRLTIIVKKGMGLEKDELIELAHFANAVKVWEPVQFAEIEDRICIAVK